MMIRIGKNGEQRVSITKPERKKLTDAQEFLKTIHARLDCSQAGTAGQLIQETLDFIDNAVKNSDKPDVAEASPGESPPSEEPSENTPA